MTDRTLEKVLYALMWLLIFMCACIAFTYSLLAQLDAPVTRDSLITLILTGLVTVSSAAGFMRTIIKQWTK